MGIIGSVQVRVLGLQLWLAPGQECHDGCAQHNHHHTWQGWVQQGIDAAVVYGVVIVEPPAAVAGNNIVVGRVVPTTNNGVAVWTLQCWPTCHLWVLPSC
jgi:hypothetical protein